MRVTRRRPSFELIRHFPVRRCRSISCLSLARSCTLDKHLKYACAMTKGQVAIRPCVCVCEKNQIPIARSERLSSETFCPVLFCQPITIISGATYTFLIRRRKSSECFEARARTANAQSISWAREKPPIVVESTVFNGSIAMLRRNDRHARAVLSSVSRCSDSLIAKANAITMSNNARLQRPPFYLFTS